MPGHGGQPRLSDWISEGLLESAVRHASKNRPLFLKICGPRGHIKKIPNLFGDVLYCFSVVYYIRSIAELLPEYFKL